MDSLSLFPSPFIIFCSLFRLESKKNEQHFLFSKKLYVMEFCNSK